MFQILPYKVVLQHPYYDIQNKLKSTERNNNWNDGHAWPIKAGAMKLHIIGDIRWGWNMPILHTDSNKGHSRICLKVGVENKFVTSGKWG